MDTWRPVPWRHRAVDYTTAQFLKACVEQAVECGALIGFGGPWDTGERRLSSGVPASAFKTNSSDRRGSTEQGAAVRLVRGGYLAGLLGTVAHAVPDHGLPR